MKMLWDNTALYVAARLEDASLFANQTMHDSIVYHDNNFEVGEAWPPGLAGHESRRAS